MIRKYIHHYGKHILENIGLSKRSSGWSKLRNEIVDKHPYCTVCNGTKLLEAHHIEPFHIAPEKELDKENIIVLCNFRRCHLKLGHLEDFKSWNVDVVEMAEYLYYKILKRPYKEGK
jgi:hypothetical protein